MRSEERGRRRGNREMGGLERDRRSILFSDRIIIPELQGLLFWY